MPIRAVAVVLLLTLLAGCPHPGPGSSTALKPGQTNGASSPPNAEAIHIWADPALEGALKALEPGFREQYRAGWEVLYPDRSALLKVAKTGNIADGALGFMAGASPDVLLVADKHAFDALRKADLIDEPSSRTFAGDRLALVYLKGDKWAAPDFYDVYLLDFKALGIGSDKTAVGLYGRQALVSDGLEKKLADRLVSYDGLAELHAALRGGRIDLAMVFASTAAQSPDLEVSSVPGEDLHEDIRYQALAVKGRESEPGVSELLRYLAEDAGAQQTLQSYGYLGRQAALEETR